ncbi:MAG: hypothetical protein IKQ31_04245 [Clostridia bacterium]|nr:hypothetical protein [Clostridia bacterium]
MKEKLHHSLSAIIISVFCVLILGVFLAENIRFEKTAASNSAVFAVVNDERLDNLVDVENSVVWNENATLSCISEGSYSLSNPYKIANAEDLIKLAYLINISDDTGWCTYSYKMTNHIDLSGYNWMPIGTDDKPFCGIFDGDGHSIYGLTILDSENNEDNRYAGLFGKISLSSGMHGLIKRLGLKDSIIITARDYVGAMAGHISTPLAINNEWQGYENQDNGDRAYSEVNFEHISFAIEDCYSIGYVQGGRRVGGLVGFIENAAIFNCYCYGMEQIDGVNTQYDVYSVCSELAAVGGLVGGTTPNGSVTNMINTITVMRVGVIEGSINPSLGHVIGTLNVNDIYDYKDRYTYNFFANDLGDFEVPKQIGELGTGVTSVKLINTTSTRNSPYYNAFRLKSQATALLTKTSGDVIWKNQHDTVWFASSKYNRGLPILWNVPQLVKVSFVVRDNGDDIFVTNGTNDEMAGPVLATYEFYDEETHSYIYEQGKVNHDAFNMEIKLEGNNQYVFSEWEYVYLATAECTKLDNSISQPPEIYQNEKSVGYACHDTKIVCNLNLKPYTIKVTALNVGQIRINNDITTTKEVIYSDAVKLKVDLNDGYIVSGFAVYGTIYDVNGNKVETGNIDDENAGDENANGSNSNNNSIFNYDSEGDCYNFLLRKFLNSEDYLGESDIIEITVITSLKTIKVTITSNTPSPELINVYYADDDNKTPAFCENQSMPYGTIINLVAEVLETQSVYEFANWSISVDGVETEVSGAGLFTFDYTIGDCDIIVVCANICKYQVGVYSVYNSYVGGDVGLFIDNDGTETLSTQTSYDYDIDVIIKVTPYKGYDYKGLKLYKKVGEELSPVVGDDDEFYARYTSGIHEVRIEIASFADDNNYRYDLVYDLVFNAKVYDCEIEVKYMDISENVIYDVSIQSQIGFMNDDENNPNPASENEANLISLSGSAVDGQDKVVNVIPATNNTYVYGTLSIFNIDYTNLIGFEFYEISAVEVHDESTSPITLNLDNENKRFSFIVEGKTIVTLVVKERSYGFEVSGSNSDQQGKTFNESFIKYLDTSGNEIAQNEIFTYTKLSHMKVVVTMPTGFEFCDNSLQINGVNQDEYQYDPASKQLIFDVKVNGNNDCEYTFKYRQKVVHVSASVAGVSDVDLITFGMDSSQVNINGNVKSIDVYSGQSVVIGIVADRLPRHYEFAYWTVNGINCGDDITLIINNIKEDARIIAVLKPLQYKLDVKIGRFGANGYESDASVGVIDKIGIFSYGEPVAISVEESDGFAFVGWYVEGNINQEESPIVYNTNLREPFDTVTQSTSTYSLLTNDFTLQFSLLVDNAAVYAIFQPVNKLMIRIGQKGAGKVIVEEKDSMKSPMSNDDYYFQNSKLLLTPMSNENWEFSYWAISGQIYETNLLEFVLTENTVIDVYFKPIHNVNVITSNPRYGNVNITRQQNDSNQVSLKANASSNCSFVGWVVDGIMVSHAQSFNMYLNGDINIEAKFKKEFNWNVVIIIIGCLFFIVVTIAIASYYIQRREEEPMKVRILLNSKDDKEVLQRKAKKNIYRDIIEPVPTRKIAKTNVAPIPVRKINVAPMTHKGEVITKVKHDEEQR